MGGVENREGGGAAGVFGAVRGVGAAAEAVGLTATTVHGTPGVVIDFLGLRSSQTSGRRPPPREGLCQRPGKGWHRVHLPLPVHVVSRRGLVRRLGLPQSCGCSSCRGSIGSLKAKFQFSQRIFIPAYH